MFAPRLGGLLGHYAAKTDIAYRDPSDIKQRFERLRGCALLPRGRLRNVQHLSQREVAAAVLSLVSRAPGYAGVTTISLLSLLPVGGREGSFRGHRTFGEAVEALLEDNEARESLIEVRASSSEFYTNAYCRASITYKVGDTTESTAYYVGSTAASLLQPEAEKTFSHRQLISSMIVETVFYPSMFRRLSAELERDKLWREQMPEMEIQPPKEDEEEDVRTEARARYLGLTSSSYFLNLGIEGQVTWPREETVVEFESCRLVLSPQTRENAMSVHIDLHGQKLDVEEGRTLVSRFLSVLSWCFDSSAVLQDGWAGNSVPVAVSKRDMAFTTAYQWTFSRKIPLSSEARQALALYREGRNADENFLVSYAVLSYYKILELKYKTLELKSWLRDNYETLKQERTHSKEVEEFEKICGDEEPSEYLYIFCRTAVAHARTRRNSSDPDDFHEVQRLHVASDVLRALARHFIENELGVSDSPFDGT